MLKKVLKAFENMGNPVLGDRDKIKIQSQLLLQM